MTTLTATAVITAVDRASAVFARVGANAHAMGGRFASAAGGVSRFGQSALATLGVPAAMVGAMTGRAQYDIDKLGRLMQSAGELSDQQRKMLTDKAFEVSTRTGQAAADILKGQRELILGGLDADTAAATSEIIAKVSRANDLAGEKVAEDAITNASALGLAMGTTEEKVASLRKALDFMSTVPAFSPMNWSDLSTAMKYVGPVAGMLKIKMGDLGTALSMLAFAGFKGEEAGTALRTILMRSVAPTPKARVELAAAGVDMSKMFSMDEEKLNDKNALLAGLETAGLVGQNERAAAEKALKRVDAKKFKGNTSGYTSALNAVLQKVLGYGKGDAQDKAELKAGIDNHVLRSVSDLDLERMFQSIGGLSIKAIKELFGLQRSPQAMALIKKLKEIATLPSGERISAWKKLRGEIEGFMEGASDRKAEPVLTGFWATIDKIGTSFGNMSNQIFQSGFGGQLEGLFTKLSTSVNSLAQTDPERLRQIGWAMTALMTAPLVGGGVAGIAALALAFTSLSKAFEGQYTQSVGKNGGIITTLSAAPVSNLITELQLLFAMDPTKSTLGSGLINISDRVQSLADTVREFREQLALYNSSLESGETGNPAFDLGGKVGKWIRDKFTGGSDGAERSTSPSADQNPDRLGFGSGLAPRSSPLSPLSLLPQAEPQKWADRISSVDRMSFGAGMAPMLPPQNVNVHGAFDGVIRNEITVRYEGPLSGPSHVTGKAAVAGRLDKGESTMDLEGP